MNYRAGIKAAKNLVEILEDFMDELDADASVSNANDRFLKVFEAKAKLQEILHNLKVTKSHPCIEPIVEVNTWIDHAYYWLEPSRWSPQEHHLEYAVMALVRIIDLLNKKEQRRLRREKKAKKG